MNEQTDPEGRQDPPATHPAAEPGEVERGERASDLYGDRGEALAPGEERTGTQGFGGSERVPDAPGMEEERGGQDVEPGMSGGSDPVEGRRDVGPEPAG